MRPDNSFGKAWILNAVLSMRHDFRVGKRAFLDL